MASITVMPSGSAASSRRGSRLSKTSVFAGDFGDLVSWSKRLTKRLMTECAKYNVIVSPPPWSRPIAAAYYTFKAAIYSDPFYPGFVKS